MNRDERFEQRWEFRRRGVDGDTSSDDNETNSRDEPANMNHELVANLVLIENDEASDGCQRHDNKLDTFHNNIHSRTVKDEEKKIELNKKKKKVLQKKSEGCAAKEKKRKRKLNTNEMVMLKDLKIFADSLIHDLTVSRENLFAHMREEMRNLVASRSNLLPIKKNVRRSQKKKVSPKNGTEKGVKPQNHSGGLILRNVESNEVSDAQKFPKNVVETEKHETRTNELQKEDKLRLSAMVRMNLAYGSDHHQLVSSSNFPLPTVLPKPQFHNQRNLIHLNDHIPPGGVPKNNLSGSEIEIGKLMAARRFSHGVAEFQPDERMGSFSHNRHRSVGLLGQNSSHIQGIGFPFPLIRGTDNSSNASGLTYRENSFMDNNGVGLRMNGSIGRFPGWSSVSSERMISDSTISKLPHKTDGEFVGTRSK